MSTTAFNFRYNRSTLSSSVRYEINVIVGFDITENLLYCNKSMKPYRSQQCHHNALFGFGLSSFIEILSERRAVTFPYKYDRCYALK